MAGVKPDGMAPSAIGWGDLVAWCQLTGERPEPWESRLLMRLSHLRAQIAAEGAKINGHSQQI